MTLTAISNPFNVTSFSPSSIPNLALWLKADQLALNDGDPVGAWNDQSGNARNFTQGTAGFKPLYKTGIQNGLPVVRFDGVDDFLQNTNPPTNFSVTTLFIALAGRTAYQVNGGVFAAANAASNDSDAFNGFVCSVNDGTHWFWYSLNGVWGFGVAEVVPVVTTFFFLMGQFGAGNAEWRINGGAPTDTAHNDPGNKPISRLMLGARMNPEPNPSFFMKYDVAEVIWYLRVISAAERVQVENYLKGRYGL